MSFIFFFFIAIFISVYIKKKRKEKEIEIATQVFHRSVVLTTQPFSYSTHTQKKLIKTMYSSTETIEEITKVNVYDDNGYLPIHRAAFNGHETTVKNILDDAQRRNELTQQLEATTHDLNEFTPLLLATTMGRLEIIACLFNYPVNFNAVDANGHGNDEKKKYFSFNIYMYVYRYGCHCCSLSK
jgi:ankyrin repeat protein